MTGDLFAGIAVRDFQRSLPWYQQWVESAPAFFPHATEAVWELGEHCYLYIVEDPERAGHGLLMRFVTELDAQVSRLRDAGLHPTAEEAHENDVRKVVYRDPDGNELSLGGTTG